MALAQFVISLREAFEAMLLVGVIIMYLKRTGREKYVKNAYLGAGIATLSGAALAIIISLLYGGLEKETKVLFEGIAALTAVAVLTYMIYWMAIKGSQIHSEVERKIEEKGTAMGVAVVSFIFVVREVFETVLFMMPYAIIDFTSTLFGVIAGIIVSFILTYAIFALGMHFPMRRFFYYTSILLILVAGGLLGYGVHELIEYGEEAGLGLGFIEKTAFKLNIPESSPLHHKGAIGSIFAVLFGYTTKAEWGRVIAHVLYLLIAFPLVLRAYSDRKAK